MDPYEVPLPDFGQRRSATSDDAAVLTAFAGERPAGQSPRFHVEGEALVVVGDMAAALRVGPGTVLVRADLPPSLLDVKAQVELSLAGAGLVLLDAESPLAVPVALQVLGLRMSCWDLWGEEIDSAFAALRAAVLGDQEVPPVAWE